MIREENLENPNNKIIGKYDQENKIDNVQSNSDEFRL